MTDPPPRRVVALGGLNVDFVFEADRLPAPGETVVGHRFETTLGGKAGNQAVAAARLIDEPGTVAMVGRVGDDWMGERMLDGLRAEGIDCAAVRRDADATTGVAAIYVDAAGENTVTAVYGANSRLDEQQVADATALLDGAAVLLLQLETPWPVSAACIRAASARGVTTILDPSPVVHLPDGAFTDVTILTPNQGEAERWSGVPVTDPASASRAAHRLRDLGSRSVIVTLGAGGVFVASDECTQHMPGFVVSPLSSLAAGDAFNGALAASLAEGMSLAGAARRAQAAAALSVTKAGAQASMPSRAQVEALLARAP